MTRTARRLLITLGFPPWVGGMQHLLYLRCCLTPEHVLVAAPGRDRASAWDRAQPFPIWRWPGGPHGIPGWRRFDQVRWAMRALHVHRPYIHALELGQALPFGVVALWAHQRWGLPYAVWVYGDDVLKPARYPLVRPLLRWVLRRAEAIYAVSHYTARLACRYGARPAKVQVIHPWPAPVFQPGHRATARRRLGLSDEGYLLLTVARLEPRKGVHVVLDALRRLAPRYPDVRYAVVGAGVARARWQRLARQLGVNDRVLWPGPVDRRTLVWWYQAADVFVMTPTPGPGEVEGFGLVYVEAAACGSPAVAGRNGGTEEAVRHGQTGLVVPVDSVHLADVLAFLLANPTYRQRLGRGGLTHAQTLRAQAHAHAALWQAPL